MMETRPLTEAELKDYFSDNELELPKELADRIRKSIGISKAGNVLYKLKTGQYGITYVCMQDTIYTPLTPIKSSIELLKEDKDNKKMQEILARNKLTLLSKVQELSTGIKDKSILCLDLNEKEKNNKKLDIKEFLTRLDLIKGYLLSNSHEDLMKITERLRQSYQNSRTYKPEQNEHDARSLIFLLEN